MHYIKKPESYLLLVFYTSVLVIPVLSDDPRKTNAMPMAGRVYSRQCHTYTRPAVCKNCH